MADVRPLEEPRHIRSLGVRFWKEYEDGTLAEIDLETGPFDMWHKPTPVNRDYKTRMFVDTWIASFHIEARVSRRRHKLPFRSAAANKCLRH